MEMCGPLTEIQDRDVTIVVFGTDQKQIVETNVTDLGKKLSEIADKLTKPQLVLDLANTEFFGSSFIEVLFRVWKRLSGKPGSKLAIVGLQPYCREVIAATRLDTFWQIYDTRQAACEAFNSGSKSGL